MMPASIAASMKWQSIAKLPVNRAVRPVDSCTTALKLKALLKSKTGLLYPCTKQYQVERNFLFSFPAILRLALSRM